MATPVSPHEVHIALVHTPDHPADPAGTARTADALAAAGHRVRLLTDRPAGPGTDGVRSGPLPAAAAPGALPDLAAAWAGDPPDVVYALGATAAATALATGLPVVQAAVPGGPVPVPGADRVLAASEDQHTDLLVQGVPRSRLRTIPAAVDTDAYAPAGESLRRGDRSRIVVDGALGRGDGPGAMIAALPRVPAAELLVAGGRTGPDEDRDRLFAAARDLGVAARVRFLGPVEGALLARLLRSADVVVAAAGHDVPADPVLRAMACGRPVVASAVGALRDVVVDRVTGVHVALGRPAELAATVRALLADDGVRTGYGIAGRDRARSRFGTARIAGQLAAVCAELRDADVPDESEVDPPVTGDATAARG
ncbi:glycosyltransferase family 4 protein [Pseudonocardia phyllosphaerae]|uniref:glycosyltransferase family 4 protein n=1 Tax=Pseudonocardia phyllosphaerae TaxID=3390502 RepID=UPI0039788CC4